MPHHKVMEVIDTQHRRFVCATCGHTFQFRNIKMASRMMKVHKQRCIKGVVQRPRREIQPAVVGLPQRAAVRQKQLENQTILIDCNEIGKM